MTRSERRLVVYTSVAGGMLTLLVVMLEMLGVMAGPERLLYDLRARYFQYFTPAPTDKLVHVDIDDQSLEAIGAWPWPRSRLGEIIDEIAGAGAKAVAMDIIFTEPQSAGFEELEPLTRDAEGRLVAAGPTTAPARLVAARKVDHDAALAAALKRFGRAIVPVHLGLSRSQPLAIQAQVRLVLVDDLGIDAKEVARRLRSKGQEEADLEKLVDRCYVAARREAAYERVARELGGGMLPFAEIRRRLLPAGDVEVAGSPVLRVLEAEYQRYRAIETLRRFARPIAPDLPPLLGCRDEEAPLQALAEAAYSSGFVDSVILGDGIVRSVPLWANHRGLAFPQFGLALACAALDVDPKTLWLQANRVVIPRSGGGAIAIPVRWQQTGEGTFGMFFDVPWFGGRNWETMYDYPGHQSPRQHLVIKEIWETRQLQRRIIANNQNLDDAIRHLLYRFDPARQRAFVNNPPDVNDAAARGAVVAFVLEQWKEAGFDMLLGMKPAELEEPERRAVDSYRALLRLWEETRQLKVNLDARRQRLKQQLGDKAVLIGWTAMGTVADHVPTSLHPRCPGVVVHGAVFNAILTGEFWRTAPRAVTLGSIAVMGLLATLAILRLSAWKALVAAVALAGGYVLFNGLCLFDYGNLVVGLAGPLVAVGAVWSGGTLTRYVLEQAERARVEGRFRQYVDRALVDYVLETDDALTGQSKELTVVFTDLAGFTTISERLKEGVVPLLNEYMGLMVPIIRGHRGYLNKFLGDGIMYFFGAPRENPAHAADAVASVLEMQEAMIEFNRSLEQRGLPPLVVRAGISSGDMVVGDAGPADRSASDYTVLGDVVNLGARLEGANKALGSRIMLNARARELAGDRFLFRPLGKLQVKGKLEGVMTYESLALMEKASDEQKKLAELTAGMVGAFLQGDFERCLALTAGLEEAFGPGKLTALYRELCQQYIVHPPADFNGQIVLTEK